MKNVTILSIILLMLMVSIGTTQAQDSIERNPIEETIMRYINAINMRDYETAYNMLAPENQTYEQFVAGYAETGWITPYMGETFMDDELISIRTILLAYQTAYTVETYSGEFRFSQDDYQLVDASFSLIQYGFPLTNASIMSRINGLASVVETYGMTWLMITNEARINWATDSLLHYFDYINQGQFENAYQRWHPAYDDAAQEQIMPQDFRSPFEQFVSGYDDTAYITVYTEAGSGSQESLNNIPDYVTHHMRVVLVAQKTDGSFETYSGCYVLGRSYRDFFRIINGQFTLMAETVPNTLDVFTILGDLDCTTLNIPM